ncbi:hypothetical protein PYW08_008974 [Mythimna loreyi]|uniref:Uncharacterized protein n=1 Tax=Mythimna loreyi TaxID=667449 RepID=A0ACC2Q7T7_9NEOP|nr:hypothetical protein PYW08_008974 [Mythimna loreyi]
MAGARRRRARPVKRSAVYGNTTAPVGASPGGHVECAGGACEHGACVRTAAGRACVCAGAWGGARCSLYVGHDNACSARACKQPALCVWGPDLSATEPGPVYCACQEGASCTTPHAQATEPTAPAVGAAGAAGAGGAWAGAVLALLALLAGVLAALWALQRRRRGAFVHARLSDNVEINNPMYLAGEDELEAPHAHTHNNGGNHFANPVYDSMYAPQQNNPAEEHANLLASRAADASPTPERAALL